jgi:hypothetical protein
MQQPDPLSAWLSVAAEAWLLGFEAATVIGLRGFRMAHGGAAAQAEMQRMVSEKISALVELEQLMLAGRLGETVPDALGRTVAHYRRVVRANHRRLSR